MVVFKPITDFPGYKIGDDGTAWSCLKIGHRGGIGSIWRKLTPLRDRKGYLMIAPRRNGKNHTIKIHRVVLQEFVGPCPKGMECRHKNGKPEDNRLVNLVWSSPKRNAKDKKRHGTYFAGEQCYTAKITWSDVKKIRELYKSGVHSQKQLGEKFGLTQTPISLILRNKTWVDKNYIPVKRSKKDIYNR